MVKENPDVENMKKGVVVVEEMLAENREIGLKI